MSPYLVGVNEVTRKTNAFVKALARVLREARSQAGWSQNELAWRAGLSQQYIGYLEKELRCPSCPSAETLKRLALAFGRDLSEIIGAADKKSTGSPRTPRVLPGALDHPPEVADLENGDLPPETVSQ